MDKELEFVEPVLDFYTREDRELILGRECACASGNFRKVERCEF